LQDFTGGTVIISLTSEVAYWLPWATSEHNGKVFAARKNMALVILPMTFTV